MNENQSQRRCPHCGELFTPTPANHSRQRSCSKPACRKASADQSRQRWLKENPGYFKGLANVVHTQVWREAHPGYWRKKKVSPAPSAAQPLVGPGFNEGCSPAPAPAGPCENSGTLQDFAKRNPLIIGILSEKIGSTLQEAILQEMERLVKKGAGILAQQGRDPSK